MTAEQGAGFAPPGGANVFRGLIVIAIALLIGIGLMARGITSDDVAAGDATTTTTTAPADDATTTDDAADAETVVDEAPEATEDPAQPAPEPLPEARDPAAVTVVVLNANGGKGVAGAATQKLDARNYVTATPKDANSTGNSVIFFEEGFQADANAVATALGATDLSIVQPLDPSSAAATSEKRQGANVMVFVGNDGLIPT